MRAKLLYLLHALRRLIPGSGYGTQFPTLYRLYIGVVQVISGRRELLVAVDGHKIYVNPGDSGIDTAILRGGDYASHEKRFVEGLVTEGDVVLDIGANIGDYSLGFARACGPRGRVYAFEPLPAAFAKLQRNVAINNYRNVVAIQAAVTDCVGRIKLHEDSEASGNTSLFADCVPSLGREYEVSATTVDAVVADYALQNVKLIKIDAQGAEAHILRGARVTLQRCAPMVALEFWPLGLRSAGSDPVALLAFIREQCYDIQIIPDKEGATVPSGKLSDAEILTHCASKGASGFCDLLLVKMPR